MATPRVWSMFTVSADRDTIRAFVVFGVLLAVIAGLAGNLTFRQLDIVVMADKRRAAQDEAEAIARAVAALGRDHETISLHKLRQKQDVIKEVILDRLASRLVLDYVEILDRYGATLLAVDRSRDPADIRSVHLAPRRNIISATLVPYHAYSVQVPLMGASLQPVGEVRVGISEGMVQRDLEDLRKSYQKKVTAAAAAGAVVLIVGLFYVLHLIGKNRRLEQSRLAAERRSYVGLLASGLAHEIRNPLNAMNMNLQMLEEEVQMIPGANREDYGELLDSTKSEIERLERLVNNFLAYARPARPSFEKTDLNRLVREIVKFLDADFTQSGVEVELELEPMLPEAELDATQFKQAVMNLLVNARQIMKHGGTITITTRPGAGGELVLEIRDTGPGIRPEAQERIFQVFFSSRGGGTGLGLPIARQIVERHGGFIELESKPGHGATFRIRIPRIHPDPSPETEGEKDDEA